MKRIFKYELIVADHSKLCLPIGARILSVQVQRGTVCSVYRPNYHVVCEKRITVKAGDEVRCMDGDGVRGQGEVYTISPFPSGSAIRR